MKAQTKAILASLVVMAVALSAVSGVTYSWWSDSENTDITVGTGNLDVDVGGIEYWVGAGASGSFTVDETPLQTDSANGKEATSLSLMTNIDNVAPRDKYLLQYDVTFSTTIYSKYMVQVETDVDWIEVGVETVDDVTLTYNGSVAEENISGVELSEWTPLPGSKVSPLDGVYASHARVLVTITILDNAPQKPVSGDGYLGDAEGYVDAHVSVVNIITQELNDSDYWNGLVGQLPAITDNVMYIEKASELAAFAKDVNSGNDYAGVTVRLSNDINLNNIPWTPIGSTTNYFRGDFDGQNHTISNMFISANTPDADQFAALFGAIKNATVKNLTVTDSNIDVVGKKVRAAAVVGIADSDKTTPLVLELAFENINVENLTINAESKSGSSLIGGVVGYSYPANMKEISVSDLDIVAKAEGNEVRAAAINGYVCGQNISNDGNTRMAFEVDAFDVRDVSIEADAYTVFAGSYAPYTYYGYITLNDGTIDNLKITVDAHEAFVGGLIGYFWRSDNGHTVNNVHITGIDFDVTTDYLGETRIGGVVGTSQSPNTKYIDCSVSGKIVERCSDSSNPVNYHAKVGGFVARTYEYAMQTYTNCVADVDVTGSNIAGGFVGNHNSTVTYINCEAKGDVTASTAGGFAGRLTEHGYTTDVIFNGCKASGVVTGTDVAGGFIGSTVNHGWAAWVAGNGTAYGKNITIKDCEITGTVSSGTDYCAGVIGEVKVAKGKHLTIDNVQCDIKPMMYPFSDSLNIVGFVNEGDVSIKGGSITADTASGRPVAFENYGNATLEGVSITGGSATSYGNILYGGSVTEFTDVDIVSNGGGVGVANGAKATFNSGSVYVDTASTSGRYVFYLEGADSELTINGGKFSWDPKDNQKRAYVYAGEGTTVYITGGEFGKASVREGYTAGILGNGTIIITGGTFGFDPSAWVSSGYKATNDDGIWTVSQA
ncbi:MAG: SipW-dependent-type signal peptide-containing protein [Candidatus Methanomethylophilaceae archaeon]|nr:SipW-dependent-type signal peptide-containing protein [Candidatus Methanomethylophilaceae archaeon]